MYNPTNDTIRLRMDNQTAADKLSMDGVDLNKKLGEIEELKREVSKLKAEAEIPKESPEQFSMQEQIVKDVPAVKKALAMVAHAERNAMYRLLAKDKEYADAMKFYRDVVGREFYASFGSRQAAEPPKAEKP